MGLKSERREDGHGDICLSHRAGQIALVQCDSWHRLAEGRDMIDHRPDSNRVAVEGRTWGLPYASIPGVGPGLGINSRIGNRDLGPSREALVLERTSLHVFDGDANIY